MLIRLLGPIGAGADGEEPVPAPGRVAAGVLGQLALAEGRLVASEALLEAVWDRPPESARNALQVAVSKLRKRYGPDLIESGPVGYRLRTPLVRIDWDEVQRLSQDGATALERRRPGEALAAAEGALRLYAGEPFAGWHTAAAEAPRHRAGQVYAALRLLQARAYLALGNAGRAVELLSEQCLAEPLAEPTHAALMEALAEAGRPAEALSVYDRLRRRLADELGADPSPGLRALFARLLEGDSRPAARPAPRWSSRTRLPSTGGPLIGRERELAAVLERLGSGHRLLTLVGPGGIGKTRLAVAVAQQACRDPQRSAVFVDLTQVQQPAGVAVAVATALDVEVEDWSAALSGTSTLVVLDNAEHVLGAVRQLAEELLAVEGPSVLLTSRSPLRLREEARIPVDVLAAEDADAPAVRLLAERAGLRPEHVRAHSQNLCALALRADGVPLVLELLASALRWYTPEELLSRLDELLPELTAEETDRPARHLSLAAVTSWSLQQATPEARAALGALTVPAGSLDLQAAAALLAAAVPGPPPTQLLSQLLDLSLVQRLPDPGRIRFRVLEPIRLCVARAELVPSPSHEVHRAHARHFLQAVTDADRELATSRNRLDDLLDHDEANIRQAFAWSWAHDPDSTVEHLGALLFAWYYRDRNYDDVLSWSERALSGGAGAALARARVALARLSVLLWQHSGDQGEVGQLLALVHAHEAELDNEWRRRWISCECRRALQAGDVAEADAWLERFPEDTSRARIRKVGLKLNVVAHTGDMTSAASVIDEALRSPDIADHPDYHVDLLNGRGYVRLVAGRYGEAARDLEQALEISQKARLVSTTGMVVNNLAWVALGTGKYVEAITLLAGNFEEPAFRADRRLALEAAVIAGLSLHRLGLEDEAARLAQEVVALAAERPGALDTYGQPKLDELKAASRPADRHVGRTRVHVGDLVLAARALL